MDRGKFETVPGVQPLQERRVLSCNLSRVRRQRGRPGGRVGVGPEVHGAGRREAELGDWLLEESLNVVFLPR